MVKNGDALGSFKHHPFTQKLSENFDFNILVYDDKRNNFSIRKRGYKLGHFVVVRKFKLSKQKKLNICATHITTQNVIRAQIR